MTPPSPFEWRDHLAVHPAADMFPLMSETDPKALRELADDIEGSIALLRIEAKRKAAEMLADDDADAAEAA